MSTFKLALGQTVRSKRMQQDMTLRVLASKAHIALSYLSDIERGVKDPSSQILGLLAKGLDLTTSELVSMTASTLSDWENKQKEKQWDLVPTKM